MQWQDKLFAWIRKKGKWRGDKGKKKKKRGVDNVDEKKKKGKIGRRKVEGIYKTEGDEWEDTESEGSGERIKKGGGVQG